jgi:hypothetical protein
MRSRLFPAPRVLFLEHVWACISLRGSRIQSYKAETKEDLSWANERPKLHNTGVQPGQTRTAQPVRPEHTQTDYS